MEAVEPRAVKIDREKKSKTTTTKTTTTKNQISPSARPIGQGEGRGPTPIMKTISCKEMREAEDRAAAQGIELSALMENAGRGAAEEIMRRFGEVEGKKALCVCGKGNNGGDALVVARVLSQNGWDVDVVFLMGDGELSELESEQREALPKAVTTISAREAVTKPFDAIVDGVFGTGFRGEIDPLIKDTLTALSLKPAFKAALDVPSGVESDSGRIAPGAFVADETYAFHRAKHCHAMPACARNLGVVKVIPIGI